MELLPISRREQGMSSGPTIPCLTLPCLAHCRSPKNGRIFHSLPTRPPRASTYPEPAPHRGPRVSGPTGEYSPKQGSRYCSLILALVAGEHPASQPPGEVGMPPRTTQPGQTALRWQPTVPPLPLQVGPPGNSWGRTRCHRSRSTSPPCSTSNASQLGPVAQSPHRLGSGAGPRLRPFFSSPAGYTPQETPPAINCSSSRAPAP